MSAYIIYWKGGDVSIETEAPDPDVFEGTSTGPHTHEEARSILAEKGYSEEYPASCYFAKPPQPTPELQPS